VLNGHPSVGPDIRERVENVIRESGFRPNVRARNLARRASGCIGFVVANRPVLQPFNAWLLNGVAQYCEERGYLILFDRLHYSPTSPLALQDLSRVLRTDGAVDAVIVAGTNYPNLIECLDRLGICYVMVGNSFFLESADMRTDQVRFDHFSGGRQAVEYLVQLGHRDIWYVGDIALPWYVQRYEGYRLAMQQAGLEPRAQVEGLSDDRFLNGLHSAEMVLAQKQPVTAIIGSTNEVAYGVWEAIERQGLQVPNDISLVGFDDERTTHKSRPLTNVSVDPEEEGRELARMAITKIQSPGTKLSEVLIPAHLVKHSTCRPILGSSA
jgi:DNA-binding LacI/PurR family transcriptional regulator